MGLNGPVPVIERENDIRAARRFGPGTRPPSPTKQISRPQHVFHLESPTREIANCATRFTLARVNHSLPRRRVRIVFTLALVDLLPLVAMPH